MHRRSIRGIGATTEIHCGDHLVQQATGSMLIQPWSIRIIGAHHISGKSQGIDAEAIAFVMTSAHEPHPPVTEQQVVRVAGPDVDGGMPHALGLAQRQIGLVERLGRRARERNDARSMVQTISAPGVWLTTEFGLPPTRSRTEGLPRFAGQQLKVAMGLTGAGPGAAVEEPQSRAVLADGMHRLPVQR